MKHIVTPWFITRLCSEEETEELRGISVACGVPLGLLVVLNVFLDGMLGCTSGGVRVGGKMMHFRTLDWDMPQLMDVLVVLEFVRSKSETPEKVVARSVAYAGFVGCLTGVRFVFFSFVFV